MQNYLKYNDKRGESDKDARKGRRLGSRKTKERSSGAKPAKEKKEEITIRGGEGGSIVKFRLHLFVQFILYYNLAGLT